MLAEFGYDGSVLETFPLDQRVPRRLMFYLTAYIMPLIYWKLLLRCRCFLDAAPLVLLRLVRGDIFKKLKVRLHQSKHIYMKNISAKFIPIRNDGAFGFFEEVAPTR